MTAGADRRATFGLIVVGDEVLGARVVEANAAFLLEGLRDLGAAVTEVVFVRDAMDAIAEAVARQSARCDVVITTGGIGPTHDDVSVPAVASAFAVEVVEHPGILAVLATRGELTPGRRRLARVPDGAELMWGKGVPWPVARIRNVWMFPGVPPFVRALFHALREQFPVSPARTSLALELVVEESAICLALDALVEAHATVAVGSYPRLVEGVWHLRLTFEGADSAAVAEAHARALEVFAAWLAASPLPA